MKIVSACLAWIKCNYKKEAKLNKKVLELVDKWEAIPVCPEMLGDLTTPRLPSEIYWNNVIRIDWKNVTNAFLKWVRKAIQIALINECDEDILKSKSPSCWVWKIYDGSFSGKLIKWDGLFTKSLKKHNIKVISDENF